MREHKYRGKRIDNDEWVYGSLLVDLDGHYYIINDLGRVRTCDDVIPETVGEYTGLHGKNGKEIYEGDIVQYKDYSNGIYLFREQPLTKDVVTWNKDTGGYKVKGMGFTFRAENYEVIGNIYDNPELLKEASK